MEALDYIIVGGLIIAAVIGSMLLAGSEYTAFPASARTLPADAGNTSTASTAGPLSFGGVEQAVQVERNLSIEAGRTGLFLVHLQGDIASHLRPSQRVLLLEQGQQRSVTLTFTADQPGNYTGTVVLYRQNLPFTLPRN